MNIHTTPFVKLKSWAAMFAIISSMALFSCNNGENKSLPGDSAPGSTPALQQNNNQNSQQNQNAQNQKPVLGQQPAQTQQPKGDRGISHYICVNNCVGSGSSNNGNCPICGEAYVHNDLYHQVGNEEEGQQQSLQPQRQQPATTDGRPPSIFNTPQNQGLQSSQPSQQPQAPAKNAQGEFHYVCSQGCAGGSGSGGNCSSCGTALVHNSAYHQ
ncbi:hypothetical protein [Membranihabitans maritimus]|uniref:hypothetical protein n=1 Tax=Membranihabitans maritimus TaxID=2904244 RepID=UPI001F3EB1BF|nr:hypothetical protein [Membranihabitans maritimus]